MQVTIIPIVIGAFGTETKGLLKGLEDLRKSKPSHNKNGNYYCHLQRSLTTTFFYYSRHIYANACAHKGIIISKEKYIVKRNGERY